MKKATSRQWGTPVALSLAALLFGAAGCNDTDERPATWSYISATIIQPNCGTSRCHAKGSAVANLEFDTKEGGYAFMNGPDYTYAVPSEPDNPESAELLIRLRGTKYFFPDAGPDPDGGIDAGPNDPDGGLADGGMEEGPDAGGRFVELQQMPPDEPLPEADIELIRKWVAAGAPNN